MTFLNTTVKRRKQVRRKNRNPEAEALLKRIDALQKKVKLPPLTDAFLRKAKSFGRT